MLKSRPWGRVVLGVEEQSSSVVWRGSEKWCTEGDDLSSATECDRFGCRDLGGEFNPFGGPWLGLKVEGVMQVQWLALTLTAAI